MADTQVVATRRRYTDMERGLALAICDYCAGNVRKASEVLASAHNLDIPYTTLEGWYLREYRNDGNDSNITKYRTEWQQETLQALQAAHSKMVQALADDAKIADANLQQLASASDTVLKQRQLLTGSPTSISQSQISPDEAKLRAMEILERRRADAGSAAGSPTPNSPVTIAVPQE